MCCTFFNPLNFEYRRSLGLNLHHHLRPRLLIIQWVVKSANYTMRGAEVHWPVVHSWHQCGTSLWHTYIDVEDLLFAIVVFTHRCGIFVENSCGTKVHKSNIRYILYDTSTIHIYIILNLQLAFQCEIYNVDICWSTSISGTCLLVHYGIFALDMWCTIVFTNILKSSLQVEYRLKIFLVHYHEWIIQLQSGIRPFCRSH